MQLQIETKQPHAARYRISRLTSPKCITSSQAACRNVECIISQFLSATSALIPQCKAENRKAAVIAAGLIDRWLMEFTPRVPHHARARLPTISEIIARAAVEPRNGGRDFLQLPLENASANRNAPLAFLIKAY